MDSPTVATILVMLGLVPSIHAFATASFSLPSSSGFAAGKTWMLGTSPSMTVERAGLAGFHIAGPTAARARAA